MSSWEDFLKLMKAEEAGAKPGEIMVRFVNRYLQPADGIKYLIKFEGKEIKGATTSSANTVVIKATTTAPVRVYAWSRKTDSFKLIETIVPVVGKPQLVYEKMKTYKQETKTLPHPSEKKPDKPANKPSQRPAPPAGPSPKTDQGVLPRPDKNPVGAPVQACERPLPDQISVEQLENIFPSRDKKFLAQVAAECNRDLAKYKLDTILRRAHFFAQTREEAGPNLKANEEGLNYQVSGLSIFKYYRNNPIDANKHGRINDPKSTKKKKLPPIQAANEEAIANHAYGNREKNGDIASGDGWRFRGRGIFQLTFRSNYTAFDDGYAALWDDEKPDFLVHPEKVMEFPYTIRSAIWFWVSNKIYLNADAGATDDAVSAVTGKINPPKHHLAERTKNFHDLTYPAFK
jgi:predicted chitinase